MYGELFFIFQSETCSLSIPELEFEAGALSLSGRFTTIEGLIASLYEQLKDTANTFYFGDSQSSNVKDKTNIFLKKLDDIKTCQIPATIVLKDPAGNSYVQVNILLLPRSSRRLLVSY